MARLFTEDFESGTGAWSATTGSPTIVTTQANTGTHSLRVNPTSSTAGFSKTVSPTPGGTSAHVYLRAYIYVATRPNNTTAIMAWDDATTGTSSFYSIKMTSTGTLIAAASGTTSGTASAVVPLNTWTRIEMDYNDATDTLTAYLNGTSWVTLTGADLSGGNVARWGIIGSSSATADIYFDDCAVNDPSGATDNGLPGPVVTSTPISDSESGAGSELQTISLSDLDTAVGVETYSISASGADTDLSLSSETWSVSASGSDLETGTGTETAVIAVSDVETASAVDSESTGASGADTEAGAGSEAATVSVSDADSGLATDTEATTQGASDTESNLGSESQSITASVSDTDTATGVDTENPADFSTGSESHSLDVAVSDSDTSLATESQDVSENTTTPSGTEGSGGLEDWIIQKFSAVSGETLVLGPGTLYIALYGATEPAKGSVADTPDPLVWTALGATSGGVELSIQQEWEEVIPRQVTVPPFKRLKSRSLTVKTQLAEATLTNLAYALNDPSGGSGVQYLPSSVSQASQLTYVAVMVDGWRPDFHYTHRHKRRRLILRKCLSTDNVESSYTKDGQTVYTVTWACHYVDGTTTPFRVIDEA